MHVDSIEVQVYLIYKYYAYYGFVFDEINIYKYL